MFEIVVYGARANLYKPSKCPSYHEMQIVVDTNFWLIPGQFRVDIFAEFERLCGQKSQVIAFSATVDELQKLTTTAKTASQRLAAKLGLQLITQKKVQIIPIDHGYADDAIVTFARTAREQQQTIGVATQDQQLKSRLKPLGVSVIVLRARSHLEIITQSYK